MKKTLLTVAATGLILAMYGCNGENPPAGNTTAPGTTTAAAPGGTTGAPAMPGTPDASPMNGGTGTPAVGEVTPAMSSDGGTPVTVGTMTPMVDGTPAGDPVVMTGTPTP